MNNQSQKIIALAFFGLSIFLFPKIVRAGYFYVEQAEDDLIVVNDGSSQYIVEYNYECYSSDFSEGDTIYIDSSYTPSYGDLIDPSTYTDKTCEVADADEVNLKKYYVEKVLDDDDEIIVLDKSENRYLVEYGIGCGLGMWRYEGKYIDIDIGGSYLDGIGDTIYLIDRNDNCKVWDAEEISSSGSSNDSSGVGTLLLYCMQTYGEGATLDPSTLKCVCSTGYSVSEDGNKCIKQNTCLDLVNGYKGADNNCYCNIGYTWSDSQNKCVQKSCGTNQFFSTTDGTCHCNDGYVLKNNSCITHTQDCINSFGPNVYGQKDGTGNNSTCYCNDGYNWNNNQTVCAKKDIPTIVANIQEKDELNCETGFFRDISGQCQPVKKPTTNDKQKKKKEKTCPIGQATSLDKTYCVTIPKNAHAIESNTDVWLCDEGFEEKNNGCAEITEKIKVDGKIMSLVETTSTEQIENQEGLEAETNFFVKIFVSIKNWFANLFK